MVPPTRITVGKLELIRLALKGHSKYVLVSKARRHRPIARTSNSNTRYRLPIERCVGTPAQSGGMVTICRVGITGSQVLREDHSYGCSSQTIWRWVISDGAVFDDLPIAYDCLRHSRAPPRGGFQEDGQHGHESLR